MNDMIDTTSDLRNQITVTFPEVFTEQTELTEDEIQNLEDTTFLDELSEYVSFLPIPTEEENNRYNEKMALLASIRSEIEELNVVDDSEFDESYPIPAGRYDHIYTIGTI